MARPHRYHATKVHALAFVVVFWTNPLFADVVCDKFEFKTRVTGTTLELSLDTDLPDDTVLFVDVGRSYFQENGQEYSHNYLDQKSTVGEWRKVHKVSISSTKWKSSLVAKQKQMHFKVTAIDEEKFAIRMTVPVFQPNAAFGDSNSRLTGKAVRINEDPRVVTKEILITFPLNEKSAHAKGSSTRDPRSVPSLDPRELDIGVVYTVSRQTPVMPTHTPADPLDAIRKMKRIPEGGSFKIIRVFMKDGDPWYQVTAKGKDQKAIGSGWINSMALIGQQLDGTKP